MSEENQAADDSAAIIKLIQDAEKLNKISGASPEFFRFVADATTIIHRAEKLIVTDALLVPLNMEQRQSLVILVAIGALAMFQEKLSK